MLLEVTVVHQFLADLLQVPVPLGQGDHLEDAVQIVQLLPVLVQLDGQHLLRLLGLLVVPVVSGGVLLRGEQGIQGDVHLPALRIVVVLGPQDALPLLHPVEVGGEDVPELA